MLVAILTKFGGVTLFTSGLGTIIALLVAKRRIPLYYGSSFSYITVFITVMSKYAGDFLHDHRPCTARMGCGLPRSASCSKACSTSCSALLIQWIGKARLGKVTAPIVTGSVAIVIGIALAGNNAGAVIGTLGRRILHPGLHHRLLGLSPGEGAARDAADPSRRSCGLHLCCSWVSSTSPPSGEAAWVRLPRAFTFPAFGDARAWGMALSVALIAIATIPESTATLYQMSLYIDQLAKDLKKPTEIKRLIGLDLVADGSNDAIAGPVRWLRRDGRREQAR